MSYFILLSVNNGVSDLLCRTFKGICAAASRPDGKCSAAQSACAGPSPLRCLPLLFRFWQWWYTKSVGTYWNQRKSCTNCWKLCGTNCACKQIEKNAWQSRKSMIQYKSCPAREVKEKSLTVKIFQKNLKKVLDNGSRLWYDNRAPWKRAATSNLKIEQ